MKILKRVLLGIVVVAVALIILLVGSVVVDYALDTGRIEAMTNMTMPGVNGGPDMQAYVARPQGSGPFPVVIMIHEFFGLNESIIGKAEGLAEEGYLVVAPDTFRGSTTAWIPRAIYQVISTRPEQINQDLDTIYAWVLAQPDALANRTGVVGFCYGGRAALGYSLHNAQLAATVVFYGSPETDPEVLKRLPGPLLGIFGGADSSIPLENVHAFEAGLQQAGVPHEITIYEGQPHAFVTDIESIHAGGVQGEAWAQMLTFLGQNLKQASSGHRPVSSQVYVTPFDWGYYMRLVYEHAFGTASHGH